MEMQAKMWQKEEKLRQLKEIVQVRCFVQPVCASPCSLSRHYQLNRSLAIIIIIIIISSVTLLFEKREIHLGLKFTWRGLSINLIFFPLQNMKTNDSGPVTRAQLKAASMPRSKSPPPVSRKVTRY